MEHQKTALITILLSVLTDFIVNMKIKESITSRSASAVEIESIVRTNGIIPLSIAGQTISANDKRRAVSMDI